MTMKETQEALIRDKLILEELREGNFPSVALITQRLEAAFADRLAGIPRYGYEPMNKGQASDDKAYNQMMDGMSDDLTTAFEATRRLNNRIMALGSYYESNRIRIDRELKRIELKAETLHLRSRSHLNRDVLSDNLNDFSNIEFKDDVARNIPRTTAFIDLRHSEVHLDKAVQQTKKYDLSAAKIGFKTLTENSIVQHLSSPGNCLKDIVEDTWRSQIITQNPSGATGQLDILLVEPIRITNLSIDMQAGQALTVTLQLSTDGDSFVDYETRRVTSTYQWVFESRMVSHIRFKLAKQTEDNVIATDYFYTFGAKAIEAREEQYLTEGYFVSKPLPINHHEAIDYIHLEADDYIPPGGNIRYYVGMDYGDNVVEWQEIEKNRPIEMKMVQAYRLEIDAYVDGYGELMHSKFGQNYYRIATLPYTPLMKSIDLLVGRHMWMKETLSAGIENPMDGDVYQTTIRDWIRAGSARKEYMSIDNYQDVLTKDTFQRYTTYVYFSSSGKYPSASVKVGADASVRVIVNNNEIKHMAINDTYPFQYKEGWNKIEVLTYARKESQEITFRLYWREYSDRIYASNKPLTQVSLYDLMNNTSNRIHDRFAVDEKNNLIVNYNPREMDIRRNGVGYSLVYNYSMSEMTKHQLRFMAILSKEDATTTASPRLKDYRIIIE